LIFILPKNIMTKVKDLLTGNTMQARGLDLQLFQQLNELAPNSLVNFEDLKINSGDGLFPYCQPSTKKSFVCCYICLR